MENIKTLNLLPLTKIYLNCSQEWTEKQLAPGMSLISSTKSTLKSNPTPINVVKILCLLAAS